MLGNSSFEGETAKMLCGCIRFGKKANAASYDVQSARQDSSSSGWSFHRSDAPSPEPLDISTDGCRSLVAPEREIIMEPRVNSFIHALGNIDEIILSNTTI